MGSASLSGMNIGVASGQWVAYSTQCCSGRCLGGLPPGVSTGYASRLIEGSNQKSLFDCQLFTHVHAWQSQSSGYEIGKHTSELQSHLNLVCRLLLEKKNITSTHSLCPERCLLSSNT